MNSVDSEKHFSFKCNLHTNIMAKEIHTRASSCNKDNDDFDELSSITVIDNSNPIPIPFINEKKANTVLEKFFGDIKKHDDGTKSAKCLLCNKIVKQSTTSTFNYGRHVHRKHSKEMEQWKSEMESRKTDNSNKQPTIRQLFSTKRKSLVIKVLLRNVIYFSQWIIWYS